MSFTNLVLPDRSIADHILLNGSGVACGDVNGDGWTDVYLCGIDGDNALYLNRGDWTFTETARASGAAGEGLDATGASLADVDGDGDLDLLIATIGKGVRLLLNDGKGHFADQTAAAGLEGVSGAMTLTLADIDGDGDLDLYVANYRTWTMRDRFNLRFKVGMVNGRREIVAVNNRPVTEPDLVGRFTLLEGGGFAENGEADDLFINQGGGKFTRAKPSDGRFRDEQGKPITGELFDWGLTAQFRDLNGDGWPDLYVCNDLQSPDRCWINQRDGTFRSIENLALRKTSWFSMGIDVTDLNHDGLDDMIVVDMLSRDHLTRQVQENTGQHHPRIFGAPDQRLPVARNTLFLATAAGQWSEVAWMAGLAATDWSWSPVFLDVDLDGHDDLLITTGFERDVQDMDVAMEIEAIRQQQRLPDREGLLLRRKFPPLQQPNLAFRNRGDVTFEEVGKRWGFDLNGISHGIALADLDNDGDLDVVINNFNGPASLLRNNADASRIAVRLKGRAPNTRGIGARVRLIQPELRQQQEMIAGGRYLSSDDPIRSFAAGTTQAADNRIEVRWRDGATTVLTNVVADRIYEIVEPPAATPSPQAAPPTPPVEPSWFVNESRKLADTHRTRPPTALEEQPLLARFSLTGGPAAAWKDLDGDGREDLLVRSGPEDQVHAYRNKGHGDFASTPPPDASALPPKLSMTAATAMGDWDGDGEAELFVGGSALPGKYPVASAGEIRRRTPAGWTTDERLSAAVKTLGLVTAAASGDLDGDGVEDLVVAVEWGSPHLLLSRKGLLVDVSEAAGLSALKGWWTSAALGDFNGDGRMDFIAGNWGRNHEDAAHGAVLLHGDLDQNGSYDLVEAWTDPATGRLLPRLTFDRLGEALPFLRTRFNTYREFASVTVETILGAEMKGAARLEARHFDSMVFLNEGERFSGHALPGEAQRSPVMGIGVADWDGDGSLDLMLAQNFFGTTPHHDRLDAGRGLILRGDGRGSFSVLPPGQAGVDLPGEQRAVAVCDYDQDGRMDFVVTQNAGPTVPFHNNAGVPALRVELRLRKAGGPALGATARAVYSTGELGPAQTIVADQGALASPSSTLLFGNRAGISAVWVRWPGGATTTTRVPPEAGSITLDDSGVLTPTTNPGR